VISTRVEHEVTAHQAIYVMKSDFIYLFIFCCCCVIQNMGSCFFSSRDELRFIYCWQFNWNDGRKGLNLLESAGSSQIEKKCSS